MRIHLDADENEPSKFRWTRRRRAVHQSHLKRARIWKMESTVKSIYTERPDEKIAPEVLTWSYNSPAK
jgi:hypothetical protein